ncbi:flavodoxin family protein [Undibacterium sp. Ji50W]|uniref:flavodoxin family protein n=1 Tax=Undibacterium sp. Ji50W TaxID=3413041 RepID=UPI003BF40545
MSEPRTVILLGSARNPGNTYHLAQALADKLQASLLDLNRYQIKPFDYAFHNQDDDFPGLIREVLTYDRIILASPIYWYAPSGSMKIFMDRLSDLLKIDKPLGRQLRSKRAAVLATGSDAIPADCFEQVFKLSFAYLGMQYEGMLYASCDENFILEQHATAINDFCRRLHAG